MTSYLKKYPPFFQLIVFFGIFLGCFVIYQFLFMGLLMPHWTGITAYDLQNGDLDDTRLLEVMKWMQILYSVFIFMVPALLFFYLSHPRPLQYADMGKGLRLATALFCIVILLLSLPAVGVLSDWNQHIHFGSLDQGLRQLNQKAQDIQKAMLQMPGWGSLFYNLVLIAVIPAMAEEMFFRGVLQRLLIRLTRRAWIGILLASVFFSLMHGEMLGFIPIAALGMILGLVYYCTGNLWYAILVHFINNGVQVLLIFLYQKHYISYDISQNEPTPLIAGMISLFVVIGLFVVFWKFTARKTVPGLLARQPAWTEPET